MEIQTLNPTTPRQRQRIEAFLKRNGLRFDDMHYYAAVTDDDGEMIAGGGLKGNVIKCVAVDDAHKGEAIANTLISHLIAHANEEGYSNVMLFTKPKNRQLFESLSFRLLAEAPEAVLMETGIGGINNTVEALEKIREKKTNLTTSPSQPLTTTTPLRGVVVMNCNPFTLGHRYLIEQAAKQVERLFVMVVREDCSLFAYAERKAMVEQGVAHLKNVTVIDGSEYAISQATFPTYFLKRLDDATDTQMLLDLDLFRRHIAPALGATVRFVGTEPTDRLTRRYNQLMHEVLTDVRETARLEKEGNAVSASRVRKAMEQGDMSKIRQLVPPTTLPYIIAHLATQALQTELDTTPKPGLVDKDNNGAHRDMDYALMQRSIETLHPYFVKLALLGCADTLPTHTSIRDIGIEAEKAMLSATNGVNTHKGALFSMGLAVVAAAHEERKIAANEEQILKERNGGEDILVSLQTTIKALAASFPDTNGTHGSKAKLLSKGTTAIKGALDNAREGYEMLFAEWLPFYIERRKEHDAYTLHKTLLRIMCDLDDTNVIYRTDLATAEEVKQEARALLDNFSETALKDMDRHYTTRNISPGGAADMLSLTIFIGSIQT